MSSGEDRPTVGVFIAWDVEEAEIARRNAGTVHERYEVLERWTATRYALWSNATDDLVRLKAEEYVQRECSRGTEYTNLRVVVFTEDSPRPEDSRLALR